MLNWYFIRGGEIVTRYGDNPPSSYTDPDTGQTTELAGKAPAELAAMGWLAGMPTDPIAFDASAQKCSIVPQVPADLQKYIDGWKAAIAGGAPLPVPMVLEQHVVTALSIDELAAIRNLQLRDMRWTRDAELVRTDRYMLLDSPVANNPAQLQAWKDYRQALRNMPDAVADPTKIVWPIAPDGSGPGASPIAQAPA